MSAFWFRRRRPAKKAGLPLRNSYSYGYRANPTVDSKTLEYGFRVIYAGFPSFCCCFCCGIQGGPYSNLLASTVSYMNCGLSTYSSLAAAQKAEAVAPKGRLQLHMGNRWPAGRRSLPPGSGPTIFGLKP